MKLTREFSTTKRLVELIGNLKELDNAKRRRRKSADLCEVGWVSPISILPIAVYANNHEIQVSCSEEDDAIFTYLDAICFQQGTEEPSISHKNYLPITRLSCDDRNDCVLNKYEDLILGNIPQEDRKPSTNSIKLLTSELLANIREHARVDDYWILAQYWNASRTCEIAMCDTGIGYKESYRGTPFEVEQHVDAIQNALHGRSSKSSEERGAGIPTIVRMFVEGYGGEVVILSGDSLLYVHKNESMPHQSNINWQGSLVGIRFKLKQIDFYQYLR